MASKKSELISKKLVKPSSSTPPSLREYKFSLIDQLMPHAYVPIAFFYPSPADRATAPETISSLLQESLSKTLSSYYPLAGRLANDDYLDCNDEGVMFLEVKVRCPMVDILEEEDIKSHDILYPSGFPWRQASDLFTTPVAVQLSHFECGGIAVSVCMSHNLVDFCSILKFLNDWAAVARDPCWKPSPWFLGASIFPPGGCQASDNDSSSSSNEVKQVSQIRVTKMFAFGHDELTKLKAKAAADSGVYKPSRVEVVTALLYKCAIIASSKVGSSESFKPSSLAIAADLRPFLGLPTPENLVGNFASEFTILTYDGTTTSFPGLVREIRGRKSSMFESYKGLNPKELASCILSEAELCAKLVFQGNGIQGNLCTSICNFPTQKVDFGWGRPTRVSTAACNVSNNFFMLIDDAATGGVQATVALDEKVMSVFENDPELLEFATLKHDSKA